MTRCLLIFVLLAFVAAQPVEVFRPGVAASSTPGISTIYSFDSGGTGFYDQIGDWTADGNYVDASSGNTIQVGNTYYRYGDDTGCGWFWQHAGTRYCGEAVYSTTDFSNKGWTFHGLMFDPAPWRAACSPNGCWRPKMIYNAAKKNWVFWHTIGGGPYVRWVCTSPTGGATPTTPGTGCTSLGVSAISGGDENVMVDPTTNIAYLVGSGGGINIYQLDSTYTAPAGPVGTASPSFAAEGVSMFYRNGTYYLLYGPLCPLCNSAATYYQTASSPLGPYGGETLLSSNSCGGQNSDVNVLHTATGTVYMYESDLWSGQTDGNQASSVRYYEPLTFTGSAINRITCSASKIVSGVVLSPPATKPAGSDQSSWASGQFRPVVTLGNAVVDYGSSVSNVLQTFIPANSGTLTGVQLSLGLGITFPGTSIDIPPNAPLTVSIVTLDRGRNPLAVLSSVKVQPTGLMYAPTTQNVTGFKASLTGGLEYGLELSTTSTNATDYSIGVAANNPYPSGIYKDSLNMGASWNTRAGKALLFSTFGP